MQSLNTTGLPYTVHMSRTLWHNTYRGQVANLTGEYVATIRVILGIPLDRSEVPDNAPEVAPHLNVQIEDAVFTADDFITFESAISDLLLAQLQSDYFVPEYCYFFYPSPSELLLPRTPLS